MSDELVNVLITELRAAREGLAKEMGALRSEMGAQLDGIRTEVHQLAARLEPVEEQLARQSRDAEIAAAEQRGARALADRMGWDDVPTDVRPMPRRSPWGAHVEEALGLLGSRGGLALLLSLLSAWLGPEVVGQLASVAEAWAPAPVSVSPVYPAPVPHGDDDDAYTPHPVP